jgi:8-oxo-dGTP pyrophosphatase MutT (NUDIX family)
MKPRWSVVAVVSRDEDILAVARRFNPHDINLPGGCDHEGDRSPAETLRRVVLEETGIQVRAWHLMREFPGEMDQPVHAFFVSQWRGKARSSSAGKTLWAKPHQLTGFASTFAAHNRWLLNMLMRV